MNGPVILRSAGNGKRPLFHPGQVLSDAALTGISEFVRSGLAAESQRHGWGIIDGFFPNAEVKSQTITISRGMLADQNGRLFVLDSPETRSLVELLSAEEEASAEKHGNECTFDLWLSIEVEQAGQPAAFRAKGLQAGFAPVVEPVANSNNIRPAQESLIARLKLRAAFEFDRRIASEIDIVEHFEAEFNKEATKGISGISGIFNQKRLDEIRACHADALAKLYDLERVKYDGIPLGRVVVEMSGDERRIKKIDWGLARREQVSPQLPSNPDYTNVASLFGLTRDEAVAWLARNGIPAWTIEALVEVNVQRQMLEDPQFLRWDLEIRAGTTAKLYMNEGRVAVVKQGPVAAEEFEKLQNRIETAERELKRLNVVVVLLFLTIIVAFLVCAFTLR